MIEIRETAKFRKWLDRLRDRTAKAQIAIRIDRIAQGNPGDAKSVGKGVLEARIDYGPGYRLYFIRLGQRVVVLLCGGDKSSQARDVMEAKTLAKDLIDER